METFQIAFSGQIVLGEDSEQVKQGIQRLFNANEQLMQQLFSGRRVVIKQKVDRATAMKYQNAFAAVGAILEVQEITETAQDQENVVPRDACMAAFSHVQAPDFGIAPVGSDLADLQKEQPVLDIDVSDITLAPVGSDMGQLKKEGTAAVPDISHIKLES